jgi:hypothetical protein
MDRHRDDSYHGHGGGDPLEVRKGALRAVLRIKAGVRGIQFNEHCDDLPADVVFRHACKLGFEVVSRVFRTFGWLSGARPWLTR